MSGARPGRQRQGHSSSSWLRRLQPGAKPQQPGVRGTTNRDRRAPGRAAADSPGLSPVICQARRAVAGAARAGVTSNRAARASVRVEPAAKSVRVRRAAAPPDACPSRHGPAPSPRARRTRPHVADRAWRTCRRAARPRRLSASRPDPAAPNQPARRTLRQPIRLPTVQTGSRQCRRAPALPRPFRASGLSARAERSRRRGLGPGADGARRAARSGGGGVFRAKSTPLRWLSERDGPGGCAAASSREAG